MAPVVKSLTSLISMTMRKMIKKKRWLMQRQLAATKRSKILDLNAGDNFNLLGISVANFWSFQRPFSNPSWLWFLKIPTPKLMMSVNVSRIVCDTVIRCMLQWPSTLAPFSKKWESDWKNYLNILHKSFRFNANFFTFRFTRSKGFA